MDLRIAGTTLAGALMTPSAEIQRFLSLVHENLVMEVACLSTFPEAQQVVVAASGNFRAMSLEVGIVQACISHTAAGFVSYNPSVITDARDIRLKRPDSHGGPTDRVIPWSGPTRPGRRNLWHAVQRGPAPGPGLRRTS